MEKTVTTEHSHRFCVAPMIDWTDRHCRYFHRLLTKKARLYSEMVVADAVIRGDRERLLVYNEEEHPVALQLGGHDPEVLAQAAAIGADFGYDEINLNVGCPSDRVQAGSFGAVLMRTPHHVAEAVSAMQRNIYIPVTIKCRLGVDEQDPEETLFGFVETVAQAGCRCFIIHARKAWLNGLSPRKNRQIPPLDYNIVYRLKESFPHIDVILNGGLVSVTDAHTRRKNLDGVMLGRAAYEMPYELTKVDSIFFDENFVPPSRGDIINRMTEYILSRIGSESKEMKHVTRHMTGLFHGEPGARKWRHAINMKVAGGEMSLTDLADNMDCRSV